MATLLYSNPTTNQDSSLNIGGGKDFDAAGVALQASATKSIGSIEFYLKKTASPTGNCYAKIYAATNLGGAYTATGAALATSDAVDVSTLETSLTLQAFTFSTPYEIQSGTWYAFSFEYTGGDASNYATIGYDASSEATGNLIYRWAGSSWDASTADCIFYIYEAKKSITLSAVQDGTHIDLSWS